MHVEAFDDALDGLVGSDEGIVVAGVGDDDIGVGGLGGGGYELLLQGFEAYAEFGLESWGLVLNVDDGLVVVGLDVGVGDAGLFHEQDDAGTANGGNRALNAEVLYLVVGVADACGVDESECDATQLNGVFDGIAGGTLNVAHDGALFTK